MGEAKVKEAIEAKEQAETLEAMIGIQVTEDDILVAATSMIMLGDFWPRRPPDENRPPEEQLRHYWSYMRRPLAAPKVPVCWNRVRCLTEAMAADHDLMVLLGGEETADPRFIKYDPQHRLFRRVCATMPIMLNRPGAASITANVYVPHDVIKSLAAGPT